MINNLINWENGGGYGAAWTFADGTGQSRIFFAANNGNVGILELVLDTVSLSDETQITTAQNSYGHGSAELKKLGISSAQVSNNDGMSCYFNGNYILEPFPTCALIRLPFAYLTIYL